MSHVDWLTDHVHVTLLDAPSPDTKKNRKNHILQIYIYTFIHTFNVQFKYIHIVQTQKLDGERVIFKSISM